MPDDPDMLVVLTTARTEFEAEALAEALRARGIRSEVFATAASSLQWEGGYTDPIKVMVRRGDLEAAEKARVGLKADSVDIDWDEVETGTGLEEEARPRRKSRLKMVNRIGWSVMALVLAFFVGGLTLILTLALGLDGGAIRASVLVASVGTLVVLYIAMKER